MNFKKIKNHIVSFYDFFNEKKMLRARTKNPLKEMVTYSSCEKTKKEKRKVLKAQMETQKKGNQKT
jgi:hypothetical protein